MDNLLKDKREFSREKIKRRLMKHAASAWGYQESDLEGFDPIVDLLFGSCAFEFERTAAKLFSSQSRILDQLANLLLPEVLNGAQPAHSVLTATPVDDFYQLTCKEHFVAEKEYISPADFKSVEKRSIYFSPLYPSKLINGKVSIVIHDNYLFRLDSPLRKEELFRCKEESQLPSHKIWIGLELPKSIKKLDNLVFYFDWKNQPEIDDYLYFIPYFKVKQGECEKKTAPGMPVIPSADIQEYIIDITNDRKILENQILTKRKRHFLTINDAINSSTENRFFYPKDIEKFFDINDLSKLDTNLVWLQFELPKVMPVNAVSNMICSINTFPVANKHFHKGSRPYLLDKGLNILPLNSKEFFLSIEGVYGRKRKPYLRIPFRRYNDQEPGTYSVRTGGMKRFESRQASEMLIELLELMRDESAYFKVFGEQLLSKELKLMGQGLNRIENHLKRKPEQGELLHYLMVNAPKAEDVWIDFWSTYGKFANGLPTNTKLKAEETTAFKKDTVQLLGLTMDGRDRLKETERVHHFRTSLLSKGKTETLEELKSKVMAKYNVTEEEIIIEKKYQPHADPKKGFVKIWEVRVNGQIVFTKT